MDPTFNPSTNGHRGHQEQACDHDDQTGITPMLVTATQVASMLQVSKRTLWRMRSGGQLPAPVRLGSSVRWRSDDIRNWIAAGCPTTPNRNNSRRRT